jgi:hypothetical protein
MTLPLVDLGNNNFVLVKQAGKSAGGLELFRVGKSPETGVFV